MLIEICTNKTLQFDTVFSDGMMCVEMMSFGGISQ